MRPTSPPSFSSGSSGFKAVEVVRDHYQDTGEDAFLMNYLFDDSVSDEPMPVNRIAKQLGN